MKTIFKNEEVAKVFVSQSQATGRNSTGSMFFDGNTIYSYGRHFPMARIIGETVFVTTQKYSITTTNHMSELYNALRGSGLHVIEVYNPEASTASEVIENVNTMKEEIEETLTKANRARVHSDAYLNQADRQQRMLEKYLDFNRSLIAKAA